MAPCPLCGNLLAINSRYCMWCSNPILMVPPPVEPPPLREAVPVRRSRAGIGSDVSTFRTAYLALGAAYLFAAVVAVSVCAVLGGVGLLFFWKYAGQLLGMAFGARAKVSGNGATLTFSAAPLGLLMATLGSLYWRARAGIRASSDDALVPMAARVAVVFGLGVTAMVALGQLGGVGLSILVPWLVSTALGFLVTIAALSVTAAESANQPVGRDWRLLGGAVRPTRMAVSTIVTSTALVGVVVVFAVVVSADNTIKALLGLPALLAYLPNSVILVLHGAVGGAAKFVVQGAASDEGTWSLFSDLPGYLKFGALALLPVAVTVTARREIKREVATTTAWRGLLLDSMLAAVPFVAVFSLLSAMAGVSVAWSQNGEHGRLALVPNLVRGTGAAALLLAVAAPAAVAALRIWYPVGEEASAELIAALSEPQANPVFGRVQAPGVDVGAPDVDPGDAVPVPALVRSATAAPTPDPVGAGTGPGYPAGLPTAPAAVVAPWMDSLPAYKRTPAPE
jgi:hypothetical protein